MWGELVMAYVSSRPISVQAELTNDVCSAE